MKLSKYRNKRKKINSQKIYKREKEEIVEI